MKLSEVFWHGLYWSQSHKEGLSQHWGVHWCSCRGTSIKVITEVKIVTILLPNHIWLWEEWVLLILLNSDLKVLTVTLSCSCLWNVLGLNYISCPGVCMLLEVFNHSRALISFFVNYAENIEPQHHDTRFACSAICTWQWSLSWLEIETMWAPLKCICSAHSRSWVMAPAALFNVLILCANNTSKSDQRIWMLFVESLVPWLRKLHDHGNSRKIGCELYDKSTNLWRWFLYIFMIDLIIMCKYWKNSQSATYCPKGTQPILIVRWRVKSCGCDPRDYHPYWTIKRQWKFHCLYCGWILKG